MNLLHVLLAILVAASWGFNFIFVKLGLTELPPLLLCAIRFLLVSFPIVFFIKKPKVPFSQLLWYSCFTFSIQFSLLFLGLKLGMPAGASALVFQTQIFFSLILAAIIFKEKTTKIQIIGGTISFVGIGFIWLELSESSTMIGLFLEIAAAACWAFGNLFAKKMGQVNPFSLVAWGCLISTPPVFILSFLLEGPSLIFTSVQHISWVGVVSIAYTTYISTGVGYVLWNRLLTLYPFSTVIPFTLLVPVFGLLGSKMIFNEPLSKQKLLATFLILLGLSINIFGKKIISKFQHKGDNTGTASLA